MSIAEQAKDYYDSQLKQRLEQDHRDDYVAIEPLSKSFFVEGQFVDAAMAAKKAYPDRKSFVIRIGHEAAFHIGAGTSGASIS